VPMSQAPFLALFPTVVGRHVFRLACSEISSWARLRNGSFPSISRKKMKQEPVQKEPSISRASGGGQSAEWGAVGQGEVSLHNFTCFSLYGTKIGREEDHSLHSASCTL
jgi:hypothetical protein